MLAVLRNELACFNYFPQQYKDDEDFGSIWEQFSNFFSTVDYHIEEGYYRIYNLNHSCQKYLLEREREVTCLEYFDSLREKLLAR